MIAIDSHGRCVYDALVYRDSDLDEVISALWRLLDRQDPPRPHLHLI